MLEFKVDVQNGTNKVNTNLGQVRMLETDEGLVIKHHVTERERFYSEYSIFAVKTAQSTVEMCRVVYEAKKGLSSSDYSEFLNDIGHSSENSTIRKYLAIGEQYDKLIQYTNLLPNSWTSIYTITQLSSETFDALTATDTDMSKMSGKQIQSLVDMNKPKPTSSSILISAKTEAPTAVIESTSAAQAATEATTEGVTAEVDSFKGDANNVIVQSSKQMQSDSNQSSSEAIEDFVQSTNDIASANSEVEISKQSVNTMLERVAVVATTSVDVDDVFEAYSLVLRFDSKPSDEAVQALVEAIYQIKNKFKLNLEVKQNSGSNV